MTSRRGWPECGCVMAGVLLAIGLAMLAFILWAAFEGTMR